jgi:hypothetical protein
MCPLIHRQFLDFDEFFLEGVKHVLVALRLLKVLLDPYKP